MEHDDKLEGGGAPGAPTRGLPTHLSAAPRPAFLLTGALLLTLAACSPREPELSPPDHVYDTQGVVYGVTQIEGRRPEIVIHHQAIPEFVSRAGEVTGMDSMTMPFTVGPGVGLEGIEEGDPVAFRFEVRWEGDPVLLVTSMEPLPPETVIDFARGERAEPAPEAVEVPEPGSEPRPES